MEQKIEHTTDTGELMKISEDFIKLDSVGTSNLDSGSLKKHKTKIISSAKETIENASKMIRRRVPAAGHLMTPKRLWLNKIPTQCDVVIEFPEHAPDEALRWLLNRLRSPQPEGLGFQCLVKIHESTKRTAFYVSAPTNILFKAAEEYRLPKHLRSDLGGALREFTTRESHCFEHINDDDGKPALFNSQERQWLVFQVLQGLRATGVDVTIFQGIAKVDEGQSIVAAWQRSGLIFQVFPLHETNALTQLKTSWVRKFFAPQPLDDIASYFGVKVALYFAWLGHYTCALCVPACLGTIIWAGLYGRGQTAQDIGHVLFSLFNVVWASLYLEAWRRYSIELAFRWGTLSTPPELLEPPRPLYKGPLEESAVTGRLEPKESPAWKRRAFRYLVSYPIIGLCLLFVFIVMFLMLRLQDWWNSKLPERGIISWFSVIPTILLAGAITLMDELYYKLAVWLNDKENYREQSKYDNHLIGKVALFQFVNSFLSLFYIAFYLRDQEMLREQLAGLLISRQIIGNLRESVLPYIAEQWRLAMLCFKMWGELSPSKELSASSISSKTLDDGVRKKDDDIEPKKDKAELLFELSSSLPSNSSANMRSIGQAEVESAYFKYEGTFYDHFEMLVQMGYVILFSSAFPLAGLCALANNLIEIRSDAFKLAHVHQRPFGQRVANIGTWQNALNLLGLMAVIVNCALIGLSGEISRLWPDMTQTQTVILIVSLEHIMLALRSLLKYILPELPEWLVAEIARAEHYRREMQCKGLSPRTTPPSPHSSSSLSHESTSDLFKKNEHLSYDNDVIIQRESNNLSHDLYDSHQLKHHRESAEQTVCHASNMTPDSPISQTSTVLCLRPLLHEFVSVDQYESVQNIPNEASNTQASSGSPTSSFSTTTQSMAKRATSSQPIQIPEIPPFRKRDNHRINNSPILPASSQSPHTTASTSVSVTPPHISEIPPFKPRKSSDYTDLFHRQDHRESSSHLPDHQLTIGPAGGAEWMRRLKVAEQSPIHRSTDCIVSKDLATISDSELLLKPTPSLSNVALKIDIPSENSGSAPFVPKATSEEEEKRAAEIAAKKSRLKQKIVKSARSVAIFSLKLKERRAREAERLAKEKAEELATEMAMSAQAMCGGGGELDLIQLEQLIHIEDVVNRRSSNSNTQQNSNASGT